MAVMKGGYVGNEPIKAMYKGKELIWQKQEEGGIPSYYQWATDDDFEENGRYTPTRFKYVGSKDYVILPKFIQGKEYVPAEMFKGTAIKGVASEHDLQGSAINMFRETTSQNLELLYLKTGGIISMQSMFYESSATSLDLSSFDTSNVAVTAYMFRGASATSLDLSSFDTSKIISMNSMFIESKATSLDLSSFDTSKVINTDFMFSGAKATKGYARTQADADKFNNSSNKPDNLIFVVNPPSYYVLATDNDFRRIDTGRYRYIGSKDYIILPETIHGEKFELDDMFRYTSIKGVAGKPSKSGSAESAFRDTKSTTLELLYLDTSNVTNMRTMFYNSQATTLDLSSFDTSNVTDMEGMFGDSQATTLDLSSFNTSSVTNMESMFYSSLVTIIDLSSFDTSNVVEDTGMFFNVQAKVGYARTQADADRLNDSWYKPDHLTFVVKSD